MARPIILYVHDLRSSGVVTNALALARKLGAERGITAEAVAPVLIDGERVSSGRIREALKTGDTGTATHLLSRDFAVEGVVQRGTAQTVKAVGKPLAGKTGTTNDAKDVWFVGFSPDLAVGVFLGYDQPKSLGNAATAGQYAAPVFRDFMQMALKDKPATPFRSSGSSA